MAQEQRGSIEGIVRDSSGGVLPGVTIEARSPSMAGVQTTVTDTNGLYRFPALPPGRYEVTAALQGFQPAKSSDVRLELGQVLKIDLAMAVGGVSENVKVTAESPLIDVKQNVAGANVQAEIIERIPKGRDFAAVVTSAPGITSESRNRGIQIDGASGADNRFLIDGVDTTNLLNGTSGKTLPVDFVDTVQAKASGYAAEYRASLGGVISAITKSGGNQYHGSAGIYFTERCPPGRRAADAAAGSDEHEPGRVRDDAARRLLDAGADLRARRRRSSRTALWFFAGYDPSWTDRTRTVRFGATGPIGTFSQKPSTQLFNYNVTGQITQNLRGRFAASNQRDKGGYGLPNSGPGGVCTSNPAQFPAVIRRDSSNDSYSGVARLGRQQSHLRQRDDDAIQGRSARRRDLQHRAAPCVPGHDEHLQRQCGAGLVGLPFPEIPANLQKVSGFADNPSSSQFVRGGLSRFNFNADVTRYATWHGQHTVKGGLQIERIVDDTLSGEQAPTVQLFWDQTLRAQRRPHDARHLRLLQRRAVRSRAATSRPTTSACSCRTRGRSTAS